MCPTLIGGRHDGSFVWISDGPAGRSESAILITHDPKGAKGTKGNERNERKGRESAILITQGTNIASSTAPIVYGGGFSYQNPLPLSLPIQHIPFPKKWKKKAGDHFAQKNVLYLM